MKRATGTVLESAYYLLRASIKEGKYAPGQRLVEADLAAEFDIGRSTVRELLRRLAGDGFLDYAPHRSAVVRFLSRAEVKDIYLIREHLEGLAAQLAAKHIGLPENRKRLMAAAKEIQGAARKTNIPDYLKHNEYFHNLIIELSGSDALPDLCERLMVPTFRLQFARRVHEDTAEAALKEHRKIVEAIQAGSEKKAESEMRRHVRNAGQMIQQLPDMAFRKE